LFGAAWPCVVFALCCADHDLQRVQELEEKVNFVESDEWIMQKARVC
jgi:hypothetical protein